MSCLCLVGLVAVVGSPRADAGNKTEPRLPKELTMLGQKLSLKNAKSTEAGFVAEYIPKQETWENWTLMLAVRTYTAALTPAQAVAMKAEEIAGRKAQGDAIANSMTFRKTDATREVHVIDFLMSQGPIVEHNIMSFSKRPDGRLASYQLARRYYRDEIEAVDRIRFEAFVTEIKTERDTFIQELDGVSKDLLE
jgi:hypothetical protein